MCLEIDLPDHPRTTGHRHVRSIGPGLDTLDWIEHGTESVVQPFETGTVDGEREHRRGPGGRFLEDDEAVDPGCDRWLTANHLPGPRRESIGRIRFAQALHHEGALRARPDGAWRTLAGDRVGPLVDGGGHRDVQAEHGRSSGQCLENPPVQRDLNVRPDHPNMDVDTGMLLKVAVVLVIVWLVFEVISEILGWISWLLGPLRPVIGLLVLLVIALFVYDRFL